MVHSHHAAAALIAVCAAGPAIAQESEIDHVAAFFADANVVAGPEIVDCTLSGGTKASCFSITVTPEPKSYTPGPWCPNTTSDSAKAGGIWIVDGALRDVDGAFITQLSEIYGDTNWQLHDPDTGEVRYTGTLEACEAAARPDVDPEYQNYCVQCLPEYLSEDASVTYVIPLEPVMADTSTQTNRTGSGLAYNGVRLDGPAPIDAILSAYTIAPFDDCGGHVNTAVGYHYHAVTDCLENAPDATVETGDHGVQIGIAMDGLPILSHLMADGQAPTALDECNGHAIEGAGYHYHAGAAGDNAILGCLVAETGCTTQPGEICDASATRVRGGPPPGAQSDAQ